MRESTATDWQEDIGVLASVVCHLAGENIFYNHVANGIFVNLGFADHTISSQPIWTEQMNTKDKNGEFIVDSGTVKLTQNNKPQNK